MEDVTGKEESRTGMVHRLFHNAAYIHVDVMMERVIVWDGGKEFVVYDGETLDRVDGFEDRNVWDRWGARLACENYLDGGK